MRHHLNLRFPFCFSLTKPSYSQPLSQRTLLMGQEKGGRKSFSEYYQCRTVSFQKTRTKKNKNKKGKSVLCHHRPSIILHASLSITLIDTPDRLVPGTEAACLGERSAEYPQPFVPDAFLLHLFIPPSLSFPGVFN